MSDNSQMSMDDIVIDLPTTYLPSRWTWKCEIDGTGYLLSPYGKWMFYYDLKPSRYGVGIHYRDPWEDRLERFCGSFDEFRMFAEQKTIDWMIKNKEEIEITEITDEQFEDMMESIDDRFADGWYEPEGRFFIKDEGMYTGIDNSSGDAFTEAFLDFEACAAWLRNEFDIEDYMDMVDSGKYQKGSDYEILLEPVADGFCGSIYIISTKERRAFTNPEQLKNELKKAETIYGSSYCSSEGYTPEGKAAIEAVYNELHSQEPQQKNQNQSIQMKEQEEEHER